VAARRGEELELTFDSLTDVITNLVGGLIMLIVLVVGATQAKSGGVPYLPSADNKVGGEQPMDQLLNKIHAMSEEVQQLEKALADSEARLPKIAEEIQELKQKAATKL
jgi:hypothetical protein